MEEIWKDVVGFEGRYQVSNIGRIRSLDRYVKDCNKNRTQLIKGKIKALKKNNRNYIMTSLKKDGKEYTKLIHRLVAEAFISNPNKYEQVNHKDEDKNNNTVENLEWCTNLYNRRYGTGYERSVKNHDYKKIGKLNSRTVRQYDIDNNFIREYFGVMEASRQTNIGDSNIRQTCYGKSRTAGGYIWKYAE